MNQSVCHQIGIQLVVYVDDCTIPIHTDTQSVLSKSLSVYQLSCAVDCSQLSCVLTTDPVQFVQRINEYNMH